VPVYLKQTAKGVDAKFLFNVPEDCRATQKISRNFKIAWKVDVRGEFEHSAQGKFDRAWTLVLDDKASFASSKMTIPQNFLDEAKERAASHATTSALEQIPITEDARYVHIHSDARRNVWMNVLGVLFGGVFTLVGAAMVNVDWWLGYAFVFIGLGILLSCVYYVGKSIETRIDKTDQTLVAISKWFGIRFRTQRIHGLKNHPLRMKKTSSTRTGYDETNYYVIEIMHQGKPIRIAEAVRGEREATALKAAIAERCSVSNPSDTGLFERP